METGSLLSKVFLSLASLFVLGCILVASWRSIIRFILKFRR